MLQLDGVGDLSTALAAAVQMLAHRPVRVWPGSQHLWRECALLARARPRQPRLHHTVQFAKRRVLRSPFREDSRKFRDVRQAHFSSSRVLHAPAMSAPSHAMPGHVEQQSLVELLLEMREEHRNSRKELEELKAQLQQRNSRDDDGVSDSEGASSSAGTKAMSGVERRAKDHAALQKHPFYQAVRRHFTWQISLHYRMDYKHVTYSSIVDTLGSNKTVFTIPSELKDIIEKLRAAFADDTIFDKVAELITVPACVEILRLETHNKGTRDYRVSRRGPTDDDASPPQPKQRKRKARDTPADPSEAEQPSTRASSPSLPVHGPMPQPGPTQEGAPAPAPAPAPTPAVPAQLTFPVR
eukprot:m.156374 g.156374  ORF g.156374 m.156374 type:complete len:354 (+) comp9802_c1_seq4:3033-4094(+)